MTVYVDDQLRPVERLPTGRVQVIPHHFSALRIMLEIKDMSKQFQEIPDRFWSPPPEDSGEDPRRVAIVSCPCGETPNVPVAEIRECGCGRFYSFLGRKVKVACGPVLAPEAHS